ncbi:MAG: hypothetical protein WBB31_03120 [Saprospiraceae bacterium]
MIHTVSASKYFTLFDPGYVLVAMGKIQKINLLIHLVAEHYKLAIPMLP